MRQGTSDEGKELGGDGVQVCPPSVDDHTGMRPKMLET